MDTEKRNRDKANIDQFINYIISNGNKDNLHEWEKALLVAGLESLMGR